MTLTLSGIAAALALLALAGSILVIRRREARHEAWLNSELAKGGKVGKAIRGDGSR